MPAIVQKLVSRPWTQGVKCGCYVRLMPSGLVGQIHCWTKNGCMVRLDEPFIVNGLTVLAVELSQGDEFILVSDKDR